MLFLNNVLVLITLVDRISAVAVFLCLGLWVFAHRAFWLQYRQTYPDRPAVHGVRLWFFYYLPETRETRIVWTPQEEPVLERARRRLIWTWKCACICGAIQVATITLRHMMGDAGV